jgi:hypothetical protein
VHRANTLGHYALDVFLSAAALGLCAADLEGERVLEEIKVST